MDFYTLFKEKNISVLSSDPIKEVCTIKLHPNYIAEAQAHIHNLGNNWQQLPTGFYIQEDIPIQNLPEYMKTDAMDKLEEAQEGMFYKYTKI